MRLRTEVDVVWRLKDIGEVKDRGGCGMEIKGHR